MPAVTGALRLGRPLLSPGWTPVRISCARAQVRPLRQRLPLLLRSGATGDSPAACITSPPPPLPWRCLLLRALWRLSCTPLKGGRFRPGDAPGRSALTPVAPLLEAVGEAWLRPRTTTPRWAGGRGKWPLLLLRHPLYVAGSPHCAGCRGWGHARSGLRAGRPGPVVPTWR